MEKKHDGLNKFEWGYRLDLIIANRVYYCRLKKGIYRKKKIPA